MNNMSVNSESSGLRKLQKSENKNKTKLTKLNVESSFWIIINYHRTYKTLCSHIRIHHDDMKINHVVSIRYYFFTTYNCLEGVHQK